MYAKRKLYRGTAYFGNFEHLNSVHFVARLCCNLAFYHPRMCNVNVCSFYSKDIKFGHKYHNCSDFVCISFQGHIKKIKGQI